VKSGIPTVFSFHSLSFLLLTRWILASIKALSSNALFSLLCYRYSNLIGYEPKHWEMESIKQELVDWSSRRYVRISVEFDLIRSFISFSTSGATVRRIGEDCATCSHVAASAHQMNTSSSMGPTRMVQRSSKRWAREHMEICHPACTLITSERAGLLPPNQPSAIVHHQIAVPARILFVNPLSVSQTGKLHT
jgi:hypothetical protein